MAFMVPENFLENFYCDECFKFISVPPIKIYPNRQIKCGRCTTIDDGGSKSLLENFEKLALFKCINRFDGCRTILTFNQVEDHEKECLSKEKICPICLDNTKLPTYQILQHFKLRHNESILQNPYFSFDIEEALEFKKVLLFRIKDYLFFIHIKSIPDSISVQIVLLGEHSMTDLKIFICSENCDVKNSSHHGSGNGRVYVFLKSEFKNNLLSFFFELEKEETIAGKIIEVNRQNKNNIESGDLLLQNKLFVEEDLQKLNPCISLSNGKLKKNNIVPFCYVCSELFLGSTSQSYFRYTQWFIENEKFQYVCLDCVSYFKFGHNKTLVEQTLLSFDMYKSIKYFCTWNCNSIFTNTELLLHEMTCSLQPLQECPIDYCRFKGNIIVIKEHLNIAHKISVSLESSVKTISRCTKEEIYLYIKGYFIKFSYIPDSNVFAINNFNVNFCKSKPKHLEVLFFFYRNDLLITNAHLWSYSTINCKIVLKKIR